MISSQQPLLLACERSRFRPEDWILLFSDWRFFDHPQPPTSVGVAPEPTGGDHLIGRFPPFNKKANNYFINQQPKK
jgi:hypothetical protein